MFSKPAWAIIAFSFLILFLELSLIRFLPAHIKYLGFFSNFILISSFFGIGLGFLLSRLKINLIYLFPAILLLLIAITRIFASNIDIQDFNNSQLIFFTDKMHHPLIFISPLVFLTILFCFLAVVFATLSQRLGRLFLISKNPTQTYFFDILGSLIGIGVFSIVSYFSLPPVIWFSLFSIVFLLVFPKRQVLFIFCLISLCLAIFLTSEFGAKNVFWSPYYRLTLFIDDQQTGSIFANNIYHQIFSKNNLAPAYFLIYNRFLHEIPETVLIIGAGSGQDVSTAIASGVKDITALDIDPKILQIGKKFHPERPYDDKRVTIINDDGRSFLNNTNQKYDLIIYALTDSLLVNSTGGNIRLESYLFTKESFMLAKKHLKENGAFILYNDYRENWLVDRIRDMLIDTFGYSPQMANDSGASRIFAIWNKPPPKVTKITSQIPEDNWPFLYLKKHQIPSIYTTTWGIISIIVVSTLVFILSFLKKKVRLDYSRFLIFFLTGAAFSLLETKSIVQLNLLFGVTWFVNSIAFSGILLSVLAACLITLRWQFRNVYVLGILLLLSLSLQYFIPVSALMVSSFVFRFILAIVYFYLPIFLANLIFVNIFAKSANPEIDFGANLLGLVLGGVSEYLALIYGYSSLALIIAIFYLLAIISFRKSFRIG